MAARALLLIVVLVAACGGGSTPTTGPTIGGLGGSAAPGATTGPVPTLGLVLPTLPGGGPLKHPFRSSGGTMLRVANVYTNAAGQGNDLDIYGDFNSETGLLLKTVPFGTATDWFDPGILDDQGDAELSFYLAGKTGDDNQVGTQTETLKGTERITLVIGAGDNRNTAGTQFAQWKAIFENGESFPLPTPPTAGSAVLLVDGIGLQAMPGSTETFVYVGVDGTCLPSVDQGADGGGQPWGPGSQQSYIFPAGAHAVSTYLGQPDCKAKSPYPDVPVTLNAGQRAFLFYYSPEGKTLKSMLLPIGS